MPTLPLKVQQDGAVQGWDLIVGATFAYQAVDDSADTSHDGDLTYLRLAKSGPIFSGSGRISFPLFLQVEGLVPTSITLNVVTAKDGAGTSPDMELGFYRAGSFAFSGTQWTPGVSYALESRTFTVSPFNGLAWTAADLIGLEACVGNVTGAFAGKNRVTLISGSLIGSLLTNWIYPEPVVNFS